MPFGIRYHSGILGGCRLQEEGFVFVVVVVFLSSSLPVSRKNETSGSQNTGTKGAPKHSASAAAVGLAPNQDASIDVDGQEEKDEDENDSDEVDDGKVDLPKRATSNNIACQQPRILIRINSELIPYVGNYMMGVLEMLKYGVNIDKMPQELLSGQDFVGPE